MAAPQNPNVGTSNAFGQPPPPSAHQFRPGTGPGPYGVPPMTGPGSFNKGPGMPPPGSAGLPNQGMPAPPQNVPMYGQRPPGPGPNMGPPVPGGIGAPPGQMITNRSVSAGSGPLPPQTSVAGPPSSYPNMPATSSPGLMGLPPHMMGEQGGGIQRSNSAPVMPASSSPGLVNGYPTSQSRTPPASHSRSTPPMGPGQMNGPPAGKVGAPPYPGQPAGAPPRPGMMSTTSVGPAPMFNQPGMPGPPRPMMSQPGPPRPPMMSQPGPPRPPMMSQPGPPRPPVPTISQPVLPASLSAPLPMTTNGPSNSSQGSVNGLPVPFHGQGQYSHQLGATPDKNTQGITPTNSAPSSQKSSRGPSPIPGTKYDALEGQFTPSPQAGPKSPPAFPVQNMPPPPMGQHAPPMGQHAPPMGQHAPPMGQHAPPMGQNLPPMMGQNFPPVSQHVPPMGQNVPPMGQNVPPMGQNVPPMGQNMPPMGQNAPPMGQNMPPMGQNAPPMGQNMPPMGAVNQGPVSQQPGGIAGRRQYPTQSYGNAPAAPPSSMSQPAPGTMPGMNASPAMAGALPGGLPQGAPQQPNHAGQANNTHPLSSSFNNMKLQPMEGRTLNLLQERALISQDGIETARPNLNHDFKKVNCSPDVFRCTLNTIPQTQSLLNKCRLPLGILIHPFKDLSQLPVIQSNVIVRCRSCRTYINPFVTFIDMRRWKCNLCYRVNELPEEFNYDPVSRTYGEPQRRPEIRSSTIEFIASSDYMLRPPQPAVYLYVLDVSFNAVSTGYLQVFCQTLLEELERIPGDSRTQIGFITFDRALHFYNLAEGLSQPQMLVVTDIDDAFLPLPDNLLVNLNESKDLVIDLLNRLPSMFEKNMETGSCLGATLQAAYKLMSNTGGRVSVFQTQLPTVGPGALKNREDPNERSGKNVHNLGPATDFYKKMSLDCSARQIAVDLFLLNSQYSDIASIAGVAKYSGGSLFNFPNLHTNNNPAEVDRFEGVVRRYVTRKVGLEAVMRIRCTRGLSIHTFHGNFFVRSTDLLSLPNINPDSGFGMQMSVEDTIESNTASFQAALLYTSSKGERRIRVHTMCLPVTNNLTEIMTGADQQAILSMLSKMAYDKCISQSMSDARDAMINAAVDMLTAFGGSLTQSQRMGQLPICYSLRLMPLFILSLLKYVGFRVGSTTKLDDRVFALEQCKTMPLMYLMLEIYPTLQPVHALDDKNAVSKGDEVIAKPPILQLSFAHMDRHGAYLMDTGSRMYLWVGAAISDHWCQEVFDVPNFKSLQDGMTELPEQDNPTSDRLRTFISHLNDQRPFPASLLVLREDSRMRQMFLQHMVEDRTENTMSYYEFLQHLQKEIKS